MFNFLNFFYTEEFDNFSLIKNDGKIFSVLDVKRLVYGNLCNEKEIHLCADDNFIFIIKFFAAIFSGAKIFIDNGGSDTIDIAISDKMPKFNKINPDNVDIYFKTSGTTGDSKFVQKKLSNILNEARDINKVLKIPSGLEFISTSNLSHTYTLTAHIFLAIESLCTINTDRIYYPEEIEKENAFLITTPSFLEMAEKYYFIPKTRLEYIISAGSSLNAIVFNYIKIISKHAFDIYGCTETGVIGYKQDFYMHFTPFSGVKISKTDEEYSIINSDYSPCFEDKIFDKIEVFDDGFQVLGRTDRVLKIHEKRILADEIENCLRNEKYVSDCYCLEHKKELGALVQLNDEGLNLLLNSGVSEISKLIKNTISTEFEISPKYLRYTCQIPKNERGKVDKTTASAFFNTNLSCPVPIYFHTGKDFAEFQLFFHKNCNFFKGHFENFPITPGVVQLFFANFFAKTAFNKDFSHGQIKRLKFSNIIRPDEIVNLKLEISDKGLKFEYYKDDKQFSSGVLPALNVFKEAQI